MVAQYEHQILEASCDAGKHKASGSKYTFRTTLIQPYQHNDVTFWMV